MLSGEVAEFEGDTRRTDQIQCRAHHSRERDEISVNRAARPLVNVQLARGSISAYTSGNENEASSMVSQTYGRGYGGAVVNQPLRWKGSRGDERAAKNYVTPGYVYI